MIRAQILQSGRLAGLVRRYHTFPMLTEQTIGEHCFQCLRIWYMIWGPPEPEITCYFLWHDSGELVTGDVPFPVKSNYDIVKRIFDTMEDSAVRGMGGKVPELGKISRLRVKACDLIDMHEHGYIELMLGNKFAQPIVDDTFKALEKLQEQLSMDDGNLIFRYLSKMWNLCKEVDNASDRNLKNPGSS